MSDYDVAVVQQQQQLRENHLLRTVEDYKKSIIEFRKEAATRERAVNDLYTERAHLIAALTKLLPAKKFEGEEEDFPVIIHIELPTGQAGWHIADADAHLFDHLTFSPANDYDGHSTELKYRRLDKLEYSKPKIAAMDLIIGYGHVKVVDDAS